MEAENKKTSGKENKPQVEFRKIEIVRYHNNDEGTSYPGVMGVVKDESGKEIAFSGCIEGSEAMIWSLAEDKEKLSEYLDGLLGLFLEQGLHDDPGISSEIAEKKFCHN